MKKLKEYLSIPSLLGSIAGAGTAYVASQIGSVGYLTFKCAVDIYNGSFPDISEILKEYAMITSAGAAIGEFSGSFMARKLWNFLKGGD
ncbi:MAG: hypothetical protein ACXQTX_04720 [Candidatus Syntropharchaeia archaeon]